MALPASCAMGYLFFYTIMKYSKGDTIPYQWDTYIVMDTYTEFGKTMLDLDCVEKWFSLSISVNEYDNTKDIHTNSVANQESYKIPTPTPKTKRGRPRKEEIIPDHEPYDELDWENEVQDEVQDEVQELPEEVYMERLEVNDEFIICWEKHIVNEVVPIGKGLNTNLVNYNLIHIDTGKKERYTHKELAEINLEEVIEAYEDKVDQEVYADKVEPTGKFKVGDLVRYVCPPVGWNMVYVVIDTIEVDNKNLEQKIRIRSEAQSDDDAIWVWSKDFFRYAFPKDNEPPMKHEPVLASEVFNPENEKYNPIADRDTPPENEVITEVIDDTYILPNSPEVVLLHLLRDHFKYAKYSDQSKLWRVHTNVDDEIILCNNYQLI